MTINWLGHSCFLFTADSGERIVIDPYDSYVGKDMGKVQADIVIISHGHDDHSAIENIVSPQKIIDKNGEFWYNGIKITTFYRYHDNKGGTLRGQTLITKLIIDQLSICHLGDIGEDCASDIVQNIGHTDILLIPVGGTYTIDSAQAKDYVDKIQPKTVIPMHYKNAYCVFDIATVDEFTARFDKNDIVHMHQKDYVITKEMQDEQKFNIILMQLA